MTWRAHISQDDLLRQSTRIFLVDDHGDQGYVIVGPGGETLTRVTESTAVNEASIDPPPTLILPNGADHALLAALSKHLGAVEHPAALRKDYDAERARVDKLIANLVGLTS